MGHRIARKGFRWCQASKAPRRSVSARGPLPLKIGALCPAKSYERRANTCKSSVRSRAEEHAVSGSCDGLAPVADPGDGHRVAVLRRLTQDRAVATAVERDRQRVLLDRHRRGGLDEPVARSDRPKRWRASLRASVSSDRRAQERTKAKPDEVVQTPVARLSGRAASRATNAYAFARLESS